MKAEQFTGDREREVLASILWNQTVLTMVAVTHRHSQVLFRNDLSNYILDWAIKYYDSYHKAPAEDVAQLPTELADRDATMARRLGDYIESLSPPTSTNAERLFDIASAYFEKVHVERLIDSLSAKVARNDTQGCIDAINGFARITTGLTSGVNPLCDMDALNAVYTDSSQSSLLTFPDEDSRLFFGDTFSRSSFVVFNAAEKAGKSQIMMEFALRAVHQGRKVAYFEAGDMSQAQVFRRIYQRIARHPRRAGVIKYPTSLQVSDGVGQEVAIQVDFNEFTFTEDMNADIARAACERWQRELTDFGINWKFSAHPQNLSVPDIVTHLDEWERTDGFIPDFVFIDYADILVSVSRNHEFRHQINDTFSRLRGVSLDRKCCLVTATQATGGAWESNVMTREFLSEDKRKAAHPTAILGLNSSHFERERQVAKLNYLVRRDDVCNEYDCLYLAQCLPVCAPMVKTYFPAIHRGIQTQATVPKNTSDEEDIDTSVFDKYSSGLSAWDNKDPRRRKR